jgi:hypothetical protein
MTRLYGRFAGFASGLPLIRPKRKDPARPERTISLALNESTTSRRLTQLSTRMP